MEKFILNKLIELKDEQIVSFHVPGHKSGKIFKKLGYDKFLDKIYTFPQINRYESGFVKHFIRLFVSARKLLKQEKPDVVITTGALIAFPFCLLAKLSGSKVVYIESFARVTNGSLTGKLVYPFADEFLVQWKSMLKIYPKAKYVGGIF